MIIKLSPIMKEKGISPKELSKQSGVAISFINYIISGEKSPTVRTLEKLAIALKVSVNDLLDDTEPEYSKTG